MTETTLKKQIITKKCREIKIKKIKIIYRETIAKTETKKKHKKLKVNPFYKGSGFVILKKEKAMKGIDQHIKSKIKIMDK